MLSRHPSTKASEDLFCSQISNDELNKTAEFYCPLDLRKITSTCTIEEDEPSMRMTVGGILQKRGKIMKKTPIVVRAELVTPSKRSRNEESNKCEAVKCETEFAETHFKLAAQSHQRDSEKSLPKLSLKKTLSSSSLKTADKTNPSWSIKQDYLEMSRNLGKSRGTNKNSTGFRFCDSNSSTKTDRNEEIKSPNLVNMPTPLFEFSKGKQTTGKRSHQMVSSYPPLSTTELKDTPKNPVLSSNSNRLLIRQQSTIITRIFKET